jgi:polyferredoxin/NAD-dependent dihydropyrimidine dehydrogenase PreA subunit
VQNPVRLRIIISSIVFGLFVLLFLGPEGISVFLARILLPLQFVPALISVLVRPEIIFVSGFVFLIIISLVLGRVYCSFLCPLGGLQDLFIALSRQVGWRKRHNFQKSYNLIRYSILGLTFITAILGSMALLNLLDPFSLFGRIISNLGDPLFASISKATTSIFKLFNVYLFDRNMYFLPLSIVFVTAGFFILLIFMSMRYGRLYCNTICPVGALLGIFSRVAIFKFALDTTNCNECRKCETVCKAGCIDSQNATIDQSRCISCFNCLHACSQKSTSFRPSWVTTNRHDWLPARRAFIFSSVAAVGSVFLALNSNVRNFVSNYSAKSSLPISPPGSLSVSRFTNSCSACHSCVSCCPTKVITPAFLAYGVTGLMQPKMDYEKGFCDYECNVCGKVCPTGAIMPVTLAEKKLIQLGLADLQKDKCIVYTKKENCGACLEVCPTHTLYSVNKNNILYPETDLQYCIGCGACERACPTDPKSIVVHANPIHKKAAKYIDRQDAIKQKKGEDKSFPF